MKSFSPEIRTAMRVLTFRAAADELRALNLRHLAIGLVCTWLVGIGRWWEDSRANLAQHLGIGSVIYVFVLALFLWLVLWPLRPPHWSYLNLVTFISLTSPPAILYALPVRHGLALSTGQTVRLLLLGVVAGWRVALLAFYLGRGAGLSGFRRLLGTVFPLVFIVFALTALNLEKVVFNIMGGVEQSDKSVNDTAYSILALITFLSFYLFIPLLLCFGVSSVMAFKERSRARHSEEAKETVTN
jgi:formate/nitrite transporter FocA (FNT family)